MRALLVQEVSGSTIDFHVSNVNGILSCQQDKTVAVKDHPVPSLGDNDVLVKTVAVAQNPTDWKCTQSGHVDSGVVRIVF